MKLRTGLLAALAAAALASAGVTRSDATFTASSASAASAVSSGDWTPPAVTLTDPGSALSGTVTLSAGATDTLSGIARIVFAVAPAGSGSWATLCTVAATPATCTFDTTAVTDGSYDLRAVATDTAGNQGQAIVAGQLVDNSAPRGYDVQTTNATSGTAGTLDTGDTFRLIYNTTISPASVRSGWSGAAVAVTVRITDGLKLGATNTDDLVEVFTSPALTTPAGVGSVNLHADVVGGNKTALFDATMTLGTTAVNGRSASVVTLVLASQTNPSVKTTPATAAAMAWTPSAQAVDLTGRAVSTAPVTERGSLDADF